MKPTRLALLALSLLAVGCKEAIVDPPGDPTAVGKPFVSSGYVRLMVNELQVDVDSLGGIGFIPLQGRGPKQYFPVGDTSISVIYQSGLWLSATQNGQPRANLVWGHPSPGNYTNRWGGRSLGVFYVTADSLLGNRTGWPTAYGAPTQPGGNPIHQVPVMYGDAMAWSALRSDSSAVSRGLEEVLTAPIEGIRVTQAVYGYRQADAKNAIFVRYQITNQSAAPLTDVYVGYMSDTDLQDATNLTGYDSSRALTYTYNYIGNSLPLNRSRYVAGYTFLGTPDENGYNIGVRSHRKMRKSAVDTEFGVETIHTPLQVRYALQGLSNTGQPMVNPTTGQVTTFAFTGDPTAGTGWLDTPPQDVRSLLGSGPFALAPGETKGLTMVWIARVGTDRADALSKLRDDVDHVRSTPELWDFLRF